MIVDVNVNLSRWPCRRLPHDEPGSLVKKLRDSQVTQAWAGSFDGLLHKDIAAVNSRLADECRMFGADLLVPFGSINPTLPDWQEDLRRCHEEHKMPGIRLHPSFHGYSLDDPRFAELLALAAERELLVQLVVRMEDERTQHPLLRVADVDTRPLLDLVDSTADLRLVVLNGLRSLSKAAVGQLAESGNVWFEIAMQEGVGGITNLLKLVPLERILFGSHFPLFYVESALLKLQESELGEFQKRAIAAHNAQKLLTRP